MKIKTSGKSFKLLSDVCNKDKVFKDYKNLCESVTPTFKSKFRYYNPLHLPPSLNMFHYGEYSLEGECLKDAISLRKIWHNIWSLENQIIKGRCFSDKDKLWMCEFETEVILRLKGYYDIEIETFV